MLAFIISGSIIAIGALAALAVGAFVGSQIDDKIEKPNIAFVPIKDDLPTFLKWPLLIGGTIFAIIIAKKLGKKVLK